LPYLEGTSAIRDSAEAKRTLPWRRWLANLLLLACSTAFTLTVTELVLRYYFRFEDTSLQLDTRYLHRFKPNSRQVYWLTPPNGLKRRAFTINAEGRRGDLVSWDRPRILVYGDSFIAALFSPIQETFVFQLQQRLQSTLTPSPQVVNCGVHAYGPDQESLVMEDEIARLKPRLIIVSIYTGNDFGDLIRDKIYKLDDRMQLEENHYSLDPSLVSTFAAAEHLPRLYIFRAAQDLWQLVTQPADDQRRRRPGETYMDRSLRKSQEEYEDYIIHGNNQVWNLLDDHYDADVSLTPRSASSRYKRILMDRVVEKMQRVASSRSVPFMLLIIPAPFDIVDHYSETPDTQKYPEYRRSELSDIVEDIAQRHQIPYVNFYKPFREHGAASLYFGGENDHWNAAGELLASELVADYIKQHHLLDGAAGDSSAPGNAGSASR
jgi:hypothetical protein